MVCFDLSRNSSRFEYVIPLMAGEFKSEFLTSTVRFEGFSVNIISRVALDVHLDGKVHPEQPIRQSKGHHSMFRGFQNRINEP